MISTGQFQKGVRRPRLLGKKRPALGVPKKKPAQPPNRSQEQFGKPGLKHGKTAVMHKKEGKMKEKKNKTGK